MAQSVRVLADVVAQITEEARRDPGVECCGLLAGRNRVILQVLPARNALASPTAFEIAPAELFRLFCGMRERRVDHLGIYHSHPRGENVPSPRDIEQAFYPDVAYFIVSPAAESHTASPCRCPV
jgi:proteasome lid subunit RPN8/RPN11